MTVPGIVPELPLFARIVALDLAASNGEARRLVRSLRIALNGRIATDEAAATLASDQITLVGAASS